jgi:hypothetical protein
MAIKNPKYQNLPLLEELVKRRGQTIQQFLQEHEIHDQLSLERFLDVEKVRTNLDIASLFVVTDRKNAIRYIEPVVSAEVNRTEASKKSRRDKLTLDVSKDRTSNESVDLDVDKAKSTKS